MDASKSPPRTESARPALVQTGETLGQIRAREEAQRLKKSDKKNARQPSPTRLPQEYCLQYVLSGISSFHVHMTMEDLKTIWVELDPQTLRHFYDSTLALLREARHEYRHWKDTTDPLHNPSKSRILQKLQKRENASTRSKRMSGVNTRKRKASTMSSATMSLQRSPRGPSSKVTKAPGYADKILKGQQHGCGHSTGVLKYQAGPSEGAVPPSSQGERRSERIRRRPARYEG